MTLPSSTALQASDSDATLVLSMTVSLAALLVRAGFWPTIGQSAEVVAGGATTRWTGIVAGDPVAPPAVTVTWPS